MKTLHVLILGGAILGAGWMLKPVPVEQVSQVELQRREEDERRLLESARRVRFFECSAGKTVDTLDRNDPKQEAIFQKCNGLEAERQVAAIARRRTVWDKVCAVMR